MLRFHTGLILLECLPIPFHSATVTLIICFVASAVGKRACEVNPLGKTVLSFLQSVKSVPLYDFKPVSVVLHMAVKDILQTHF